MPHKAKTKEGQGLKGQGQGQGQGLTSLTNSGIKTCQEQFCFKCHTRGKLEFLHYFVRCSFTHLIRSKLLFVEVIVYCHGEINSTAIGASV